MNMWSHCVSGRCESEIKVWAMLAPTGSWVGKTSQPWSLHLYTGCEGLNFLLWLSALWPTTPSLMAAQEVHFNCANEQMATILSSFLGPLCCALRFSKIPLPLSGHPLSWSCYSIMPLGHIWDFFESQKPSAEAFSELFLWNNLCFSILEFLWRVRHTWSPIEQSRVESLSTVASRLQETAKQNELFI